MKIDKNTQVCISISSSPGNTGNTIHNYLYDLNNLNFIYKSFKVEEEKLKSAIDAVSSLGMTGCSVSMPFKKKVIDLIDDVESSALRIESVNTVLNKGGKLLGYNTDIYGAEHCIKKVLNKTKIKRVVLFGCGATGRSTIQALVNCGFDKVHVFNRTKEKTKKAKKIFSNFIEVVCIDDFEKINISKSDLLINTTSLGMKKNDPLPIPRSMINSSGAVIDVVVPETKLQKLCKENKIFFLGGQEMAIVQALKQFEIYTGKEVLNEEKIEIIRQLLK